jgi:hypothetical protein
MQQDQLAAGVNDPGSSEGTPPVQLASSTGPTQPPGVQSIPPQPGQSIPPQTNQQPSDTSQQEDAGLPVIGSSPEVMQDVPSSMKQQQPSAFQANGAPQQKKSRKKLFCSCFLIIFTLFVLGTGGLGAYAYYTDTEIPIISDIVRKIELLFKNPREEANTAVKKLASTLIGTLVPIISQDEDLEQILAEYENVESVKFDLALKTSGNNLGNYDISITGAFDSKEKGNEKGEANFNLDFGGGEILIGEFKQIGEDLYVKVDQNSPTLALFFNVDEGQWFTVEADESQEMTSYLNTNSVEYEEEVKEENIKKIMEFISDETVIKNIDFLPSEEVKGEKCDCLKLYWNHDELVELLIRYAQIFEVTYEEEALEENIKNIDNLQVEICTGKSTKKIHRVGLKVYEKETIENPSIQLDLKLWDYDEDIEVEAPNDFKTLDEVMGESLFSEAVKNSEVKYELKNIQDELENYYEENIQYPESLSLLELEQTTFYGEEVYYESTGQGYKLWIILPSGEKYELAGP